MGLARRRSTSTRTSSPAASASGSASPRALTLNPRLIVADEPVSALDVSIQSQILNMMKALQQVHRLTYIVISHDLAVLKYLSDRIGVMYLGKLVEIGDAEEDLRAAGAPLHPGPDRHDPGARSGARRRAPGPPHLRRAPLGHHPAVGLPVPDPLPAGTRHLRRRGAPGPVLRRRPPGGVPLPAPDPRRRRLNGLQRSDSGAFRTLRPGAPGGRTVQRRCSRTSNASRSASPM